MSVYIVKTAFARERVRNTIFLSELFTLDERGELVTGVELFGNRPVLVQ